MQNLIDASSIWLSILVALGLAALIALAIWTFVRAPGRRQDPGLPRNRPGTDGDETGFPEASSDDSSRAGGGSGA